MTSVLDNIKAKTLVISFNNEAYISRIQMEELLSGRGELSVIEMSHDRYVGARIGIYNPSGQKVGKVGHLKNSEYLYVLKTSAPAVRPAKANRDKTGGLVAIS